MPAENMNSAITVLMYHAVGNERGKCAGADAHYTITWRQFDSHLALSAQAGLRVRSVAHLLAAPADRTRSVAFTFDDGHRSNGPAAERIARAGGSADFFVNPSLVGKPHNLGWSDLRSMADAGMSIQSHGQEHRYLDDLSPAEVVAQLVDSKKAIEDHLGRPVTLFAPPGGRMPPNLRLVAARAGYAAVCSSRVGLWRTREGAWDVPRLAVLQSTSDAQLARWVGHDWWELTNRRACYLALASAKRLLGNHCYERLRGRLLRIGA
ncbi:MAG: polysaccharide deacetylase family protein [Mesorhizobium sp.]|nr:MAG: polysaccharide deacetylase family protein [Mesorhizobium sp.]